MRKVLVLPFLFLLVTLLPNFLSCVVRGDDDDSSPEGTPSSTATAALSAISIDMFDMTFNHTVGETDCPQPIGTIVVTNNTDTEATVTHVLSGDGATLIELDPPPGTVAPGASFEMVVYFNCQQPSSFTANLEILVDNGAKTNSRSATITGNVAYP